MSEADHSDHVPDSIDIQRVEIGRCGNLSKLHTIDDATPFWKYKTGATKRVFSWCPCVVLSGHPIWRRHADMKTCRYKKDIKTHRVFIWRRFQRVIQTSTRNLPRSCMRPSKRACFVRAAFHATDSRFLGRCLLSLGKSVWGIERLTHAFSVYVSYVSSVSSVRR